MTSTETTAHIARGMVCTYHGSVVLVYGRGEWVVRGVTPEGRLNLVNRHDPEDVLLNVRRSSVTFTGERSGVPRYVHHAETNGWDIVWDA